MQRVVTHALRDDLIQVFLSFTAFFLDLSYLYFLESKFTWRPTFGVSSTFFFVKLFLDRVKPREGVLRTWRKYLFILIFYWECVTVSFRLESGFLVYSIRVSWCWVTSCVSVEKWQVRHYLKVIFWDVGPSWRLVFSTIQKNFRYAIERCLTFKFFISRTDDVYHWVSLLRLPRLTNVKLRFATDGLDYEPRFTNRRQLFLLLRYCVFDKWLLKGVLYVQLVLLQTVSPLLLLDYLVRYVVEIKHLGVRSLHH